MNPYRTDDIDEREAQSLIVVLSPVLILVIAIVVAICR